MELGPPAPSSKHLVGKHAWPSEGGDMGFPFLGARLFPAQSLFPASQGRNRRCCSKWKVGGVKHAHSPLSHLSWRCLWAVFGRDPAGWHQGPCLPRWVALGTSPVCSPAPWQRRARTRFLVCGSPFILPVTAILGTHLSPCFSRQLVGAEQLNSPCWPRGRREDKGRIFFPGARAVLCHPYSSTGSVGVPKASGCRAVSSTWGLPCGTR